MQPAMTFNVSVDTTSGLQNEASSYMIANYIVEVALAVHIYNMLLGIQGDVELIKKGLSVSTCLYLLTRVILIIFQITTSIFTANPEWHALCSQSIAGQAWLLSIFTCLSAFIFFLRIRAIFFASRKAVTCFFLLWLAVLGACLQKPRDAHASLVSTSISTEPNALYRSFTSQTDPPQHCEVTSMGVSCLWCNMLALIFDTIVFLSLAWRILHFHAAEDTWQVRFGYFLGRLHLPCISETVLRGSQKYYIISLCMQAIAIGVMHVPGIALVVRFSIVLLSMVIVNAAACRLFRDLKLCLPRCFGPRSTIGSYDISSLVFAMTAEDV